MVPFDRFAVVLDACTIFPMLTRDVLLTLATHEFFSPKWSPRIRTEWTRNLLARLSEQSTDSDARKRVESIVAAMGEAFPDAEVETELAEPKILEPVSPNDRHVVVTALATHADAIVTFNVKDFAVDYLKDHMKIEVIHPDDFVMDLVKDRTG
jgi:predicted nucleic acid-binding protein